MTSNPDYRLYLEDKFEGIEKSLNRIEKHLEKQNGSIVDLQIESNKMQQAVNDFYHLEQDYKELKDTVKCIDKELDAYYLIKKNPKFALTIIAVMVIMLGMGIVQTIKSWGNTVRNIEIMNEIDRLNYKLIEIYGVDPRTRGLDANVKSDTIK